MAQKNDNTQWVGTSKQSVFAFRPFEFDPQVSDDPEVDTRYYKKITLTQYCQEKFISKSQARTLIRKKWLAITRFRGHIWVHEICPDQIHDFLLG
jgi:hypothetical protein